jgi:hypothetical protein
MKILHPIFFIPTFCFFASQLIAQKDGSDLKLSHGSPLERFLSGHQGLNFLSEKAIDDIDPPCGKIKKTLYFAVFESDARIIIFTPAGKGYIAEY